MMNEKKIHIKNMVCNRCIMVVESELKNLAIQTVSVGLGIVELEEPLNEIKKEALRDRLERLGFSLLDNKKIRLVEQIKNLLVELVHFNNDNLNINISDYLSDNLHHDYNYMSHLFSEIENTTIERYFIAQKIERVKELLTYNELSLKEIAFMLNYSSAAHLSMQFKKITGLTPSQFKQTGFEQRKPLDQV